MEKLLQLKAKVCDVATDAFAHDWYLMMWLKFHKMDVAKTEAAIRLSVAYRQKFHFGTDSKSDFPEAAPNEIAIFCEVGRDGLTPVFITKIGSVRVRSLKAKYGKEKLIRMFSLFYYNAEKEFIERVNSTYEDLETKCNLDLKVLCVSDYGNFSLMENAHPSAVEMFLHVPKATEWDPVFQKNTVVLNASRLSAVVLKGVQGFVKGDFQVFLEGDEGWKAAVSKYIDPLVVIDVLRT